MFQQDVSETLRAEEYFLLLITHHEHQNCSEKEWDKIKTTIKRIKICNVVIKFLLFKYY